MLPSILSSSAKHTGVEVPENISPTLIEKKKLLREEKINERRYLRSQAPEAVPLGWGLLAAEPCGAVQAEYKESRVGRCGRAIRFLYEYEVLPKYDFFSKCKILPKYQIFPTYDRANNSS